MDSFHRTLPQSGLKKQTALRFALIALFVLVLAACSGEEDASVRPTRTPLPTWTATPLGGVPPTPVVEPVQPALTNTPPSAPATDTPVPAVADTPTPEPSPTEAPTPEPTPTPDFAFELETAEKFPTETLAANMVRIYLYVYSPEQLGLAGYRLRVVHDGSEKSVDGLSEAGLPKTTRDTPGPYSRFTNMNAVFVEPQGGRWEVQLLDPNSAAVGQSAVFELTADEVTRELYVRYRLK